MKLKNVIYTCAMMCMFFVQNGLSQGVELVKYQIRYNTSTCLWDCYLIIQQGAATTAGERLQANAQYSLVTQAGATLTIVQNYMPLNGNQTYTGTIPLKWNISSVVNAPAVTPTKKYFGITPSLSPSSFYNDLAAGDTIRLFSVSITPTTQCGANIWLFRNGIDPSSSAPGMAGGDFSNGFSVGSPDDVYNGNLPNVNPPLPIISAVTACSAGLEIDLTASTSACQSPLTYAWSGPAGYTSTTQDVAINPATLSNAGQYKVVVTDTRGCKDSIQLDAQVKPSAGADLQACAGGSTTLTGTGPDTGSWSALGTNAVGAVLTPTTPGNATVDFSSTANGEYKFIYTAGPCSDTMSVNVILPDAGPNPTDVGCFASGTASMSAVGVGTWSVSPMSAGTAIIADPSNPNTTVSGFSSLGTYFLVWTVGTCTDIAQIVVGDNCTCLITGNSVASVIPNTFCGTSGTVNLDGGSVTPAGGVYTWEQSLNNGSYSAAPGLNTSEDYQTPNLTEGVYRFRRTYFLAGDPPCNDTSNVIMITVNASPAAPTPLTANPNPICLGTSVALAASNTVGATYTWSASSANAGLVSTTTNSTTMNPLSSGIYTISVTQTISGCISPPASVTVTANSVPPTPTVSTVTSSNPTACSTSTGSIFFSGLEPNTAYQFDYRKNNVVQSAFLAANNLGVLELSGQTQGSYTNFMFTNADGCASGIYAGPVVLTDPSAPDAPADLAADPNPTCANQTVTLTVTNTPGATYNWTASSPNAGLINSTTSTATMLPSLSGFYDVSVTQTIAGCTSAPSNIGISINDTPPTPAAGTVSAVNPTGCGLATGSIRISGLQNLTAYSVTYSYNGVPNTVNPTTSNTGILTIPGLASGTYTSFVVTNISGCSSGTYLGPVNLVDPSTPSAPVGLTAVPNPVCLGSSVNLSVTNTVGATYTWTATPVGNGLVTTTGSSTTMLPTLVGVYNINVTQTIAGCTSLPATTTVTVNPTPPTPTAGTVSFVNPAVCGASTGSISFSGLLNNTAYTILYTRNGNASTANVTSNGSGVATITGLNAATYAAFRIQNAVGCTSGTYAGPVTLLDPSAPTAPSNLTANPNPVCPGISVALAVTVNAGATYTWSASSPSAGLVSSVTNTTTMSTLTSGLYTISVTQTVAGCTSPASSMQVTVNPAPPTPTAGTVTSTNPSVCAGNDGTISLSGLLASTLYTINYTKNGNPLSASITTNGAGTAVLTGLNAGSYSNFSITNGAGCSSGTYTGSISLSDPNSPAAPSNLTAIPNPACIGTNVSLSVTNNVGAVYAWSSSSTNAVLSIANSTVNTNDMVATAAGSYTISVTQNVAGCTSPPATVIVTINPTPPTLSPANVASTNPTTCGGSQGSIILSGLPAATTYTVNYFKNGNAVSSIITTDGSGNATINGLTAGTYANFTLAGGGNCPGGTYTGSVNLTDPPIPSAPSGLTALPNPACLGVTVNLNVTNNVGAVYNWSASSANAGLVASATNATTMLATVAGTYNISVTQIVAGCLSASSNIQVVINPVPSTPLVGNIVPANPTSCLGTDGSLAISGYLANTSYSVEYTKNGSPVLINLTSDGAGVLLISNLTAGVYADFKVTNTFGCSSLILTAQITLSDPPAQGIPANLTALPNPSCLGTPVNLSVTNEVGATYAWSISSVDGGLNAGSTSTASMIAVTSGLYTVSVTKTVAGCISSPATLDITVNAPPVTPASNNFSVINPTCGNSNGSISINGLLSNQSYSVDFVYNSNSITRIITVDGTGVGVLSGFAAGIFSDFTITNAQGCTSGLYVGPIELTDPGSPSAPTGLITTPDQICIRSTINISVDNNPAASYAWSVSDIGAGLQFSSVNNTMMLPTAPGLFTVSVTQTINGCTSPPASVVLEVKADCYNPDFDVTFANIPLTGDVSTNDVTLDMKTYTAITAASGNPSACLPVLAADGTYTFNCGVTGRFNYTITVCHGISTTFCVSVPLVITVLEPLVNNNPPIANSDYIRTKTATPIRLNVIQNDKCQSASNCTLDTPNIIVNPLHGTYDPFTMMYTPGATFIGTDSMLYEICQNPVVTPTNCQQAWAYILVVGDSSPNVTNAMDDYGQTQLNTPLIVTAANGLKMNDSDPEGDQQLITPMNVVIANKGAFIVQDDGSYIFTPVTGYIGPVDCPYEICDNNQDVACDIATIHLLVEPSLPDGTIGNRVWHDQNGDGVQNGSEPGIAGVQVKLYTAAKTLVATKTTSSIGEYSFTNVRPGSYYLQFVAPGGYDFTFANRGDDAFDSDVISGILKGATAVFEVRGGDVNNSYDAGMYKCSRIGDKVWYDLNKNDVWNTNENGINEIQVILWRNHFGVWLVWDDTRTKPKPGSPSDDGHYEFCAPPGQYYVEVVMPPLGLVQALPNRGNNPLIDSDLTNNNGIGTTNSFSLTSGQNKLDLGAGFYPMATAGNLVWMDLNQNGVQETNEPKVEGVKVEAFDAETHDLVGDATTDVEGAYRIAYLQKKEIYFKFDVPANYSATVPTATTDNMDSDVDHSFGPNTTRRISMQSGLENVNIDMGIMFGVLPVDWLYINAKRKDKVHHISWATQKEVNVSHYQLERRLSKDGDFEAIGDKIVVSESNNQIHQYETYDFDTQASGLYYYRVKQVDFDGKYTYSDVVYVSFTGETDIVLYPSPAVNESNLEINLELSSTVDVKLFDASSRLIQSVMNTTLEEGGHTVKLDLNGLHAGVYNVVITINGQKINKKLIKIE